jgi:hypothetical protein
VAFTPFTESVAVRGGSVFNATLYSINACPAPLVPLGNVIQSGALSTIHAQPEPVENMSRERAGVAKKWGFRGVRLPGQAPAVPPIFKM